MKVSALIPLIGELLALGFKITEIIDKAQDISPEDKAKMKELIVSAKGGVTYWTDEDTDSQSENPHVELGDT